MLSSNEAQTDHLDFFLQTLQKPYRKVLRDFRKTIRFLIYFHFSFMFLFLSEIYAFLTFFLHLSQSLLAFTLAGIFLTVFSYFILLFYFQAKKPEQLRFLQEEFLEKCKSVCKTQEGETTHHLTIAHAVLNLSDYLNGFEKTLFSFPFFSIKGETFSKFFYLEDVFRFKELLYSAALQEHYAQIRIAPVDLEAHTSLANTYVGFSKYLLTTKKEIEASLSCRFRFRKLYQTLEESFRRNSERAVEEYKILQHYVPDDPWVHLQLAKSYEALDLLKEETSQYEILYKLMPEDETIQKKLGILYFRQGLNGKGLEIYEKLKESSLQDANELIHHYGCFHEEESLITDSF